MMAKQRFVSVWDAIESDPAEAENMKLRARLLTVLRDHLEKQALSQAQAAKLLGVSQPRVSDLMRGKIDLFGLDTLVNMLARIGKKVELRVARAA